MPMVRKIVLASVVEGHGELSSVPILLGRIADLHRAPDVVLSIPTPQRLARGSMLKPESLRSYLDVAAARMAGSGAVFIFLDADDDAACVLGPRVLGVAQSLRSDLKIVVSVSVREFEAVFIAAAASLGLTGTAAVTARNAKGEIERLLGHYAPTIDQQNLVRKMSLNEAMAVPHMARLSNKIGELVR